MSCLDKKHFNVENKSLNEKCEQKIYRKNAKKQDSNENISSKLSNNHNRKSITEKIAVVNSSSLLDNNSGSLKLNQQSPNAINNRPIELQINDYISNLLNNCRHHKSRAKLLVTLLKEKNLAGNCLAEVKKQIKKGVQNGNRTFGSWASSWTTKNSSNDKLSQEWTIKNDDEYLAILQNLKQCYEKLEFDHPMTHSSVDAHHETFLQYQIN
ncbi:MAG: hypothetical protein GY821_04465 [Gammaproteobacteria bacterium]|nr:hypothetical protein [Gammaproteobacteria bacterium]